MFMLINTTLNKQAKCRWWSTKKHTFSWGPSIVIRKIPRDNTTVLNSKSHPPFANKYDIELLTYWTTYKMKNFNVLKGCVVRVKLSSSSWYVLRIPAKLCNLLSKKYSGPNSCPYRVMTYSLSSFPF